MLTDSTVNYKRSFIILDEQSNEFRGGSGKAAAGYAKIEGSGSKTRVGVYIQNVAAKKYAVHCICVKESNLGVVECGEIYVGTDNKAELTYESSSEKLFTSDYNANDIVGVSVASMDGKIVLDGFKSEKYRYAISPQEAADNENKILDKNDKPELDNDRADNLNDEGKTELIEENQQEEPKSENEDIQIKNDKEKENPENEESIDNINENHIEPEKVKENTETKEIEEDMKEEVKEKAEEKIEAPKEKHLEKKDGKSRKNTMSEELKTGIGEKIIYSERLDSVFIPFENASMHFKWVKRSILNPGLSDENQYVRKIMMLPHIYQMCTAFGHYILGMGDKHVIVGVPGKYKDTYRYMEKYSNICEWVKMSETMWDYGYWLFYLDRTNGGLVYVD